MSNQTLHLPLVPLRDQFIPSEARDLAATAPFMGSRSFPFAALRVRIK
jgi:hypothetical protein